MLSSVDNDQTEPVKFTAVRADPPVTMPTKEETKAAAASAGYAVSPSSLTATNPWPLGQQLEQLELGTTETESTMPALRTYSGEFCLVDILRGTS